MGHADESFILCKFVKFQSGDYKLGFFKIACIEIVDDDIGIQDNLLEELNFACLHI